LGAAVCSSAPRSSSKQSRIHRGPQIPERLPRDQRAASILLSRHSSKKSKPILSQKPR
jgi:hypothetical protein